MVSQIDALLYVFGWQIMCVRMIKLQVYIDWMKTRFTYFSSFRHMVMSHDQNNSLKITLYRWHGYSISIDNALEILQSCIKPSTYGLTGSWCVVFVTVILLRDGMPTILNLLLFVLVAKNISPFIIKICLAHGLYENGWHFADVWQHFQMDFLELKLLYFI